MTAGRVGRMSAVGIALAVLLTGTGGAHAAPTEVVDPVQAQVDAAMAAEPGGVQVGPGMVEWGDGAAMLTVTASRAAAGAVGSCATGSICVYDQSSLRGAKLAFTTCSTFSTAGLGAAVKSMVNARTSGYARAYNAESTLLSTIAPGVSVNSAPTGVARMVCSP
jgi:hypothetical protein